jgi:dCMP deaminase
MKDKHIQMYLRVAEAVALTSSAIRLQVGAVAVKNNMIIGTGYNALPSGVDGNCEDKIYEHEEFHFRASDYNYKDKNGKYRLVTKPDLHHAEKNLIINLAKSTESSRDCSVFMTHSCCPSCAKMFVDSGIKEVYYIHNYRDSSGIDYLKENGVKVEQIKLEV